jgi:hypothetical protein
MASPPNFKIFPGMPSGPTDCFLPIVDNSFLIMLILMAKSLHNYVGGISGKLLQNVLYLVKTLSQKWSYYMPYILKESSYSHAYDIEIS